jgi:hypothetical protein
MLTNGNVSERPREKIEMPDDDFEQLNAGASFHMREVQVGDEAQNVQDDTFFLHQYRRGQCIDSSCSTAATVIVTCVGHRM